MLSNERMETVLKKIYMLLVEHQEGMLLHQDIIELVELCRMMNICLESESFHGMVNEIEEYIANNFSESEINLYLQHNQVSERIRLYCGDIRKLIQNV
jgi:hypothetical protein